MCPDDIPRTGSLVVMEGGERRDAEIGDGNEAGRVPWVVRPSLDLYLAPSEAQISSRKRLAELSARF